MLWLPPMPEFLHAVRNRLVVVGSVARTVRNPDFELPKDIDLLCDLDSDVDEVHLLGQQVVAVPVEHVDSGYDRCPLVAIYECVIQADGLHQRCCLVKQGQASAPKTTCCGRPTAEASSPASLSPPLAPRMSSLIVWTSSIVTYCTLVPHISASLSRASL